LTAGHGVYVFGYGIVHLYDESSGRTISLDPFTNLVTTVGDEYYARKAIVGIGPTPPTAPTAVNGMKLGTGTTAVAKSGTGAALTGTYITGSNNAFDSGFPTATAVGTDIGWYSTYKTTWPAGDATNTTINEVVIVNDQATDATSTVANTYARAILTTVNKAAGEALAITWQHKFLGAP
jgi:hypothetical protein